MSESLDLGALSKHYTNLSAKMVLELASGIDEPLEIAKRYGFTEAEWATLEDREDLNRLVSEAAHELKESGITYKNKAKLFADKLLDDVFKSAIDVETPVKDKVQALQTMAKLGGLDLSGQIQAQGTGFSIQINLPSVSSKESSSRADVVVEGKGAEVIDPAEASIKLEFKDGSEGQPVRAVAEDDEEESEDGRGERSSEEDTSRDA